MKHSSKIARTSNRQHRLLPALCTGAILTLGTHQAWADGADQVIAFWDFNTASAGAPSTTASINNTSAGTPAISFTAGSPITAIGTAGVAYTSHSFSGNPTGLNTAPRHIVAAGNAHGWNDVWVGANASGNKKGTMTVTLNT